jgi:hypothetical protein
MKLTADEQGRLTSTELFRPGAAFDATRQRDGSIRIVELMEPEVPVVEPIRTKEGFLISPVKIPRDAIRRAVRMDRDAR